MQFEFNSIKFNEIQIHLKNMLITFVINDYGAGKSKTTAKKCLSIPFTFQTEIYFSTMKQLPNET
jgi:hypothetical protein